MGVRKTLLLLPEAEVRPAAEVTDAEQLTGTRVGSPPTPCARQGERGGEDVT